MNTAKHSTFGNKLLKVHADKAWTVLCLLNVLVTWR